MGTASGVPTLYHYEKKKGNYNFGADRDPVVRIIPLREKKGNYNHAPEVSLMVAIIPLREKK